MADTREQQQTCRSDSVASDFAPLFTELGKPIATSLDAGLVTLVAKINTPQFRRIHPTRR